MFTPPRCPYRTCPAHERPSAGFFIRFGSYWPECRERPVPRFRCRRCRRTFSRQTFRADYRDHKPHLNLQLFSLLTSGVGLRQAAREIEISLRNVQLKFRKLGRHLRHLHERMLRPASRAVSFSLDEAQTFEGCRDTRPLTVPVVIEQDSFFLVDARCGAIPASGGMNELRRKAIARERERHGSRPNRSNEVVYEALERAAKLVPQSRDAESPSIEVRSDRKSTYPRLLAKVFGPGRVRHWRVSSKEPRTTRNPLHRINLMLAIARDLVGRLRRRSWLVSKRAHLLDLHLAMFACYRNYVRPRFNGESETPAQLLGLAPRPLRRSELLGWRQDWRAELCLPVTVGERAEGLKIRPNVQTA